MTAGATLGFQRLLTARWRKTLARGGPLHAVLANSAWLMADRMLRMVLAIVVGSWVARHLGPANYGELAYGIALVALWQAIAALGLDAVLVRDIARHPDRAHLLLGTALRLRLSSGLFGWAASLVCVAVLRPGDGTALLITAILGATLLFQVSDLVDLWFQSQTRSKAAMLPRSVAYVCASLAKIALILLDAPLATFAAALLFEASISAGALALAYRGLRTAQAWAWQRKLAVEMLREAWPFMVAGVSVTVYARIDQIMLRSLSEPHELGLYSAIIPFSQAWQIIPLTLCASLLPKISVLKVENPAMYMHRLMQLFSLMWWLGIFVAAATAFVAPWLVAWLLGPGYADAVPALRWHACTNVFIFLGVAQSLAIVSDGQSHIALVRTVFGALVSVALNALLVPRWGAVGAAWSAVAANFCAAVVSNAFLAPRYLRLQLLALWPFHPHPR